MYHDSSLEFKYNDSMLFIILLQSEICQQWDTCSKVHKVSNFHPHSLLEILWICTMMLVSIVLH